VDGLIKFINTEGVRMTGALDASQIIGQSALRFVHPDHVEMTRQRLNAVVDGQKAPMTELKGLRLDGSEMDLEVTAAPIVYRGKRAAQLVYRDVTERKRLEHAVLEISAREQQRIGQDLHDGLTQHLVGVAYLSQSLQSKLAEKEAAEAADVTRINQLLDDALSQTRHLARGLFPVKLEENGLASSLTELASGIEDIFKMSCRFTCEKSVVVRDNVVATHLYRIAQEAVHNAIRHGQAKVVSIALDRTDNAVTLTVTNDGASFPKELRKGDGMGLDTMAYRARAIGATLDIHGGERGGTVVRCSVPGI
jgi:PAS domain S-box-containing protein